MTLIQERSYTIRLAIPFLIAFVSLRHIFHELHEFAHMAVGRLLCGAWGTRDFNNVHPLSGQCSTANPLLGLEGPLVNYIAIWVGAIVIRTAKTTSQLSWGLTLIFASLPFARLFTALIGGGDEMGVARTMLSDSGFTRVIVIAVVLMILIYPLYMAMYALSVKKYGGLYFLGFLLLPMLLEGAVVLGFFNYLLKLGVLNRIWILGSPILVSVVFFAALLIFAMSGRYIKSLTEEW